MFLNCLKRLFLSTSWHEQNKYNQGGGAGKYKRLVGFFFTQMTPNLARKWLASIPVIGAISVSIRYTFSLVSQKFILVT